MRFANDVAIVTGGAQGIGLSLSQALAKAGARLVIADIDEQSGREAVRQITEEGGQALFVPTDVSSEQSAQALAAAALAEYGAIQILINNAALFRNLALKPIEEIAGTEWDRVLAVNLRGPFNTAKAVLPHMKRQRRGKIVNISSNTVFSGGPGMSHYVASKAGVIGFTRCLAREVGAAGICANVVAPGLTDNEAAQSIIPAQRFDAVTAMRSIGRRQTPADLVGAVLFLCSADSDFITGQVLNVDGGQIFY
jgi:NAD(P)-dependent dehydrogenase (short-subunit alcohol dehydrogenase family)